MANAETPPNVVDYLFDSKDLARCALQTLRDKCSYGDLRTGLERIAAYLLTIRSEAGERVLLVGENSFFWAAAYLGIMRAGMVCVPLPATTSAVDLLRIAEITGARIAILQALYVARNRTSTLFDGRHLLLDKAGPSVAGAASQRDFESLEPLTSGADASPPAAWPVTRMNDLAALMFTSGSTGEPRGVMVSHRNIVANTESIVQYLELVPNDRIMTVVPWHYCFGASLLHSHLRAGASLVIDNRFAYPEDVLNHMEAASCTSFAGVPSHYQILLRNSTLAQRKFPHLRYVQQAGGRLAPVFVNQLRQALPIAKVFLMYGQTEATARLSYMPPDQLEERPGSIGRGIPGVTLHVIDSESGRAVEPGAIGEIVAEGDNITLGYWQAPEDSDRRFRNGKLYTGDLATVDSLGFLYIVDRATDFLKCGGKRVSCREIEDKLLQFEDLLETAVVGVPDDILGEAVRAFVVPRSRDCGNFVERLSTFCRVNMPSNLQPREFVQLSSLPKGSGNKVLKWKLKEAVVLPTIPN